MPFPSGFFLFTVAIALVFLIHLVVLVAALARSRPVTIEDMEGRGCRRCGAELIPLLDSSHIFRGEAVCRNGHQMEGITWLPSTGPAQPPGSGSRS